MATGAEETLAFGITKAAITTLVKPITTSALAGLRSLTTATIDLFTDRFSQYLSQQTEKHGCLSTIVFGHQKRLEDLYIPLTITPHMIKAQDKDLLLLDRFNPDFLPKTKRALINDTAGMGKSTITKFLFLQCVKSCYAIPFFIELRHLSSTQDVLTYIQKQLNPSSLADEEPKISKKQIERLFRKSNIVCFFDGYDEIPLSHRETVTRDIKNLIEKFPDITYVITSRPESGLLAFSSFKHFSIKPLKKDESFELIRKYDDKGGRSEQLIVTLDRPEYRPVHEFLKNPLLTSLLYRSFEYKQSVPLKKHVFYRQVFDALFDWHDASKDGYNTREKKSGLDIDSFHRILRVIGFVSVLKGEIEGDTDTVLKWIRTAKGVCNATSFPESSFLDDVVRAVPVFVKDGDSYRWSHKSLAEYFAAQYLCTEGKSQLEKVIGTLFERKEVSRFTNVLDQIYDIDPLAFREFCILPVAKAFNQYAEQSYRKMDVDITAEEIRLRRACTFDRTFIFFPDVDLEDKLDLIGELEKHTPVSTDVSSEFEAIKAIIVRPTNSNKPRIIVDIAGPYSSILEILQSKKDPLVIQKSRIDWPSTKSRSNLPTLKSPEVLGDEPTSHYNEPMIFTKVTKLIAGTSPVVDTDKMFNFVLTFNDSKKVSSLADDLLNELIVKKTS
ncbi:NACHT domain-containing protein [Variovorax sp. PCZ-1]|uniref:NACHT domain-containing protein n=1 Tax=Variovorax sp. PCZ-1 TaxID=2835533 RepID=UPI001BCCB666|nr:NACHT domain-containing protein [Variovorax sp. PCZ-1]MBS7806798.1 NACHT domain-containing protein [Variovorax sp. PCZ-1]